MKVFIKVKAIKLIHNPVLVDINITNIISLYHF